LRPGARRGFELIARMEEPCEALREYALILDRVPRDIDENHDSVAVLRMSTLIGNATREMEALRGELFDLTARARN
jgi:hypothetical protein